MRETPARSLPAPALAICAAALSLAAGGCLMQASYSVNVTTADGVTLEVPLTSKFEIGPSAQDETVEVGNFRLVPQGAENARTMAYEFLVHFKGNNRPASIVIEDDTEEPIRELYTDTAPKVGKGGMWFGKTQGFNPNEERMNWVNTLDNGVRVLRLTVTLTDKSVHVLRLPIFVPAQVKAYFRAELGVK
jgi:hypothetical protein